MAVPPFEQFLRPTLELHADGLCHHVREMAPLLADHLAVGAEDRCDLTPSGRVTRVQDRTYWAVTYLRQAGLIENTSRAVTRITETGQGYLARAPQVIRRGDLMEFPSFRQFREGTKQQTAASAPPPNTSAAIAKVTPEDAMEEAHGELNIALAQDLLDRVKSMPPSFFEHLIVNLMLRLGYGSTLSDAGETLGKSGDGGVDGVIRQDKLGLDKVYLQAKRWSDGAVGRKDVQAFVGALSGQGANKGVFITTSSFTREAREYARFNQSFKLSLVDGMQLARLMVEHDLGVSLIRRYDVKQIDTDYFSEEPSAG